MLKSVETEKKEVSWSVVDAVCRVNKILDGTFVAYFLGIFPLPPDEAIIALDKKYVVLGRSCDGKDAESKSC